MVWGYSWSDPKGRDWVLHGRQGPRDPGTQGPEALPSTAHPLLSALSRGLLLFPSQQPVVAHSFWVPKSSETDISLPQFRSPADCLIPVGAHRRHFCIWDEGVVGGHGHRQVGLLGGEDFPERPRIPGGSKQEGGVGPESIHRNHKSWAADCGDLNAGYLYIKCQCVLAFGWPSLSGRLSEKTCPARTLPGQPSSGGAETGPPQVWSANQKHQHRSGRIGMYQKCRFLSPVLDLAEPLRLLQPWDWFWQLSFENCGAEETGN